MTRGFVHVVVVALAACALAGCSLLGASPEPEDVELRFEGLESVDRGEAVRRIAWVFEGFDDAPRPEPMLDDAAFELELLLRERGHRDAKVEATLERPETGKPIARFAVDAGVRTKLDHLRLPGVPEKDRDDARAIARGAGVEDWYSERAVAGAARALLAWYRDRGHADALVGEPAVTVTADGKHATVEIAVTPGPRYVLRRVDVATTDGPWPDEVPRAAVDAALKDLVGGPYSEGLLRIAPGRIAGVFGDNGHPDAVAKLATKDAATTDAVLSFTVAPGPRVKIGKVRFEGEAATDESFLSGRVVLEEGAWYRRSLLRASLANLSRAGLFDRIAIDLQPAEPPDAADPPRPVEPGVETRDVVVEVEEAAAREFHIEPGYGSYERLRLGFGARQRNLFGTGRTLDFSATAAELAQRADLSLIDPWLLGPEATAIATVFWNRRDEPSFRREEQGVLLGASWRLTDEWGVRGQWQFRQSDVSDVEVDAPELIDDVDVSEVSFLPTWDTRDAFDDPRRGHVTRAGLDVSADVLGSEIEYVRVKLEHAHYLRIDSEMTLALSGRVGVIVPVLSTDDIPIQERFFNGGENSVRSFEESELGPVDSNGTPVGGEATTTLSVELRRALGRRWQAAAFVDMGTVELQARDVFDFGDPGLGVGLGLRYLLPIGPVRLDGALNPDPDDGESDGALHLSVGFAF